MKLSEQGEQIILLINTNEDMKDREHKNTLIGDLYLYKTMSKLRAVPIIFTCHSGGIQIYGACVEIYSSV